MARKTRTDRSSGDTTSRDAAEACLAAETPSSGETLPDTATDDPKALIRELRVRQFELEMRNAGLRTSLEELTRVRDHYIDLYDFAPVGYLTVANKGALKEANFAIARMLRVPRQVLVGARLRRFVTPADQATLAKHLQTVGESGKLQSCEIRMRCEDEREFDAVLCTVLAHGARKQSSVYHIAVTDISERKQAEQGWQQAEAIIHAAQEAIFVLDRHRNIVRVNPAFLSLTHYDREQAVGRDLSLLLCQHGNGTALNSLWRSLNCEGRWEGELWCKRRDGEIFPAHMSCTAIPATNGDAAFAVVLHDVTERKRAEGLLRVRAYYDAVTGLPNRILFAERLEAALQESRRHGHLTGLLYVDLDRFKEVNDLFGHAAGDALLSAVAERLKNCVRERDTVARVGGDEFAIVLTDVDQAEDSAKVADKVLDALTSPILHHGAELPCSVSIGIAVYPIDAQNTETLRRHADLAMYYAKSNGRGRFSFFAKNMTQKAREIARARRDIKRAVRKGEFIMYYQPIVHSETGQLAGAEALLRWQHPEKGLLNAEAFLPMAEETSHIIEIGDWVVDTVCRHWHQWCAALGTDHTPFLCINISSRQLRYPATFKRTLERIKASRLGAEHIVLEITENTAMESGHGEPGDNLASLKRCGVGLALDDFGTGYTSINHLKLLPLDIVKIDRSFIRDAENDAAAARTLRAITDIASGLQLKVIAEGIENQKQWDLVKACGCGFSQGYHIAPPMPAQKMHAMLTTPPS